jgi:hypothetical protein
MDCQRAMSTRFSLIGSEYLALASLKPADDGPVKATEKTVGSP